jgi:hypothetical protein
MVSGLDSIIQIFGDGLTATTARLNGEAWAEYVEEKAPRKPK